MDQEQKSGMSAAHIVMIVLGVAGLGVVVCAGVIIVCLVAITALGTSANKTFTAQGKTFTAVGEPLGAEFQAGQAARQFVSDLGAGLTQAAWDQTSVNFHDRHIKVAGPDPSKYFADFLQKHPGLRNPAAIEVKSLHIDPSQPTVQATITPKSGGKIILHLKLIKEMEILKVNDVTVFEEKNEKDGGNEKGAPLKKDGKD